VGVSNPIQSLPATLQDLYTNDPWRNIVNPKLLLTLLGTANLRWAWPLQERSGATANDFSGNSRNGTYDGPTLGGIGPNQRVDGAVRLDGVNDLIAGAAGCSVRGLAAVTFVTVAQVTALGTNRQLWFEGTSSGTNARFSVFLDADNKLTVAVRIGVGGDTITSVKADDALSVGYYITHAAVDVPGGAITIAINGVDVAATGTINYSGSTFADTAPNVGPHLGWETTANNRWYDGGAAYAAMFSRVLTAAEKLSHARAGGFA
jgi:hypothetical protein